jgi:threonine/homoserine/homoserine lactone efflux protein
MPSASTLILFTGAALILAAMPGPGLFYIAGRTLAAGRGEGLASCLGSALGGLVHVLAGAVGISALIMASANAFMVLKVLGGLYLIYLGIQTWRCAGSVRLAPESTPRSNAWRAIRQGFIVEATNPKTAAFFLALIPQFIEAGRAPVPLQFGILGLISIVLNTGMAVLAVMGASALRRKAASRPHLILRLRQGSGAILGSLGLSLLVMRRPA